MCLYNRERQLSRDMTRDFMSGDPALSPTLFNMISIRGSFTLCMPYIHKINLLDMTPQQYFCKTFTESSDVTFLSNVNKRTWILDGEVRAQSQLQLRALSLESKYALSVFWFPKSALFIALKIWATIGVMSGTNLFLHGSNYAGKMVTFQCPVGNVGLVV